jgi:hypothetical protein
MHIIKNPLPVAGDTIIEVMVSMSVLGLVIGTAFATSRHSLQAGLQAGYRNQAQSYAQQQVELLKTIDEDDDLSSGGFFDTSPRGFCVDADPSSPTFKQHISIPAVRTNQCIFPAAAQPESQYTITVKYTGNTNPGDTKTFIVEVAWPSSSGGSNRVTNYYKSHESYIDTPGAYAPPTAPGVTPPSPDWVCFYSNLGSPCGPDSPSVAFGTQLRLFWVTTPTAQSCTGSGGTAGWSGSRGPNNTANGHPSGFLTAPLTSNVNFTLQCSAPDGTVAPPKTIAVTVSAAPPPTITTFTVTPTSVTTGSQVTVTWAASSATTCTASGPWSTGAGSPTSGSVSSSPLFTSSSFSVTCSGPGGTVTSSTITVSVAGGLTGAYYRGADFNLGPNWMGLDPNINWGDPVDSPAETTFLNNLRSRTGSGYPASCVSVRWTGQFLIDTTGIWTLTARIDDGVRLWVDGVLRLNDWGQNSQHDVSWSGSLSAGWHFIRFDYHNNNGAGCGSDDRYAVAKLLWAGPSVSQSIVPSDHLRP